MKHITSLFSIILLTISLGFINMAFAQTDIKPFIGKVAYNCQQGKKVTVRYSFNKYGLPTSASTYINGKKIVMERNQDSSDNVETYFGLVGKYNMVTNYMDSTNYRSLSGINILSPSSEILFKGCDPR